MHGDYELFINSSLPPKQTGHGLDAMAALWGLSKRNQYETDVDYRQRLYEEIQDKLAKTN